MVNEVVLAASFVSFLVLIGSSSVEIDGRPRDLDDLGAERRPTEAKSSAAGVAVVRAVAGRFEILRPSGHSGHSDLGARRDLGEGLVSSASKEPFEPRGASVLDGAGAVVSTGDRLETGPDGWAEVVLRGEVRARLSASTSMRIVSLDAEAEAASHRSPAHLSPPRGPPNSSGLSLLARPGRSGLGVELDTGRLWVQTVHVLYAGAKEAKEAEGVAETSEAVETSSFEVVTEDGRCRLLPGASAVVERRRGWATTVIVRAGAVDLWGRGGGRRRVGRGMFATLGRTSTSTIPVSVRPGGHRLADVVVAERRAALGDLEGLEAFVLDRAREHATGVGVQRSRVRLPPALTGLIDDLGSPDSRVIEHALRPPPFFETEVPPKGPNARVEIVFDD